MVTKNGPAPSAAPKCGFALLLTNVLYRDGDLTVQMYLLQSQGEAPCN